MWVVEARKFGQNPDYWYMSGLTQEESKARHQELYDQGWAMVHSYEYENEEKQ
jgi:hypothetical protein